MSDDKSSESDAETGSSAEREIYQRMERDKRFERQQTILHEHLRIVINL